MNDGIILRTSPEFTALRKNLLQAIERLDGLLAELRPSIRSETYLTSEEVRMIFDLCPRSLPELPRQPADSLYDHRR